MWASIALIQVAALPGFLLTRWLRLDEESRLQTVVLSFGFSLLINHYLVWLLVLAGLYQRPTLIAVLAIELAVAVAMWRRRRPPTPSLGSQVRDYLRREGEKAGGRLWLLLAAGFALGYMLTLVPGSFQSIFSHGDAVGSWNRWALDWHSGHLPRMVWHYPQLLPASWSTIYVLQGNTLQFVPHGMMALFPAATVAMLVDLGLRRRKAEFHLAAVLASVLLVAVFGEYIGEGLADIPSAFFALLALYPLLAADPGSGSRQRTRCLVACALAGAAGALTKQAGLYMAAVIPIFVWLSRRDLPRRPRLAAAGAVAVLMLALVLPWYGYVEIQSARGLERSEVPVAIDVAHQGRPLEGRFGQALELWGDLLPEGLVYLGVALALLAVLRPQARWVTLLITVPYTCIWVTLFSYDLRNLALAVPFLALSIAWGCGLVVDGLRRARAVSPRATAAALVLAVAAVLVAGVLTTDREAIFAESDRQWVERVGKADLSTRLLRFHRNRGFEGKILAPSYRALLSSPDLQPLFFIDRAASHPSVFPRRIERFIEVFEDPANEILYVVTTPDDDPQILAYLEQRLGRRELHAVFSTEEGSLIRVLEPDREEKP